MPTISIEGKACFYQDIGEGYPLLLGHSYLWTSAMWEPQLESLAQKFRCIVPDLWGHGRSGYLSTKNTTIGELAEDYWKLMESLEISEFAVVGLSVGGMWAAQLALNHPNAVKALVLMDTFVGEEPQGTREKYFALLDILEREKGFAAPLIPQIVPLFFSSSTPSQKPHLVEGFRNALAATSEENIPGIVALGRAIFSRNCLLDQLPRLTQPTLILVGKDDIPRPPKESQEMASRLPHAEMHVIEHAGHISNLEQPEQVNAFLSEFLGKHLQKRSSIVSWLSTDAR